VAVGVLAMLLALTHLSGAAAAKEMISFNILASDTWAFFQAKNVRQASNQLAVDVDERGDGDRQKLTPTFAAGTGPDLGDANPRALPTMSDGAFVLRLDARAARDKVTLEAAWASLGIERWRPKTFGVPAWAEPCAVASNRPRFRQGVWDGRTSAVLQAARVYTWCRPPSTGRVITAPVEERAAGWGVSRCRVRCGRSLL
jgi:hypothetical protein